MTSCQKQKVTLLHSFWRRHYFVPSGSLQSLLGLSWLDLLSSCRWKTVWVSSYSRGDRGRSTFTHLILITTWNIFFHRILFIYKNVYGSLSVKSNYGYFVIIIRFLPSNIWLILLLPMYIDLLVHILLRSNVQKYVCEPTKANFLVKNWGCHLYFFAIQVHWLILLRKNVHSINKKLQFVFLCYLNY